MLLGEHGRAPADKVAQDSRVSASCSNHADRGVPREELFERRFLRGSATASGMKQGVAPIPQYAFVKRVPETDR